MSNYSFKIIDKASPEDAFLLTSIAKESKASWGYEQELLDLWSDDLTISEEHAEKWKTYVSYADGHIVGFCMIDLNSSPSEVEHLWLLPKFQGKGIGKRLLQFALDDIANEVSTIGVTADPFAEAFYSKMGFIKTHSIPSKPEGRRLPYLLLKF